MAGPPFAFANHFQVVGHFIGTDPQETWRSEIAIASSTTPVQTDAIILAIRDYFRHNLRSDCTLSSLELRQWTFGPQPLASRGSIWVLPLSLIGEKPTTYTGEQAAPALAGKEVVAFIKQFTTSAKPGKQFLRQLYDLGDIGAVAGSPWEVLPGARVTAARYLADTNALFTPYFGGAATPGIVVVHFSKKAYNAAPGPSTLPFSTGVTAMQLIGPSTNRPTRKNKR